MKTNLRTVSCSITLVLKCLDYIIMKQPMQLYGCQRRHANFRAKMSHAQWWWVVIRDAWRQIGAMIPCVEMNSAVQTRVRKPSGCEHYRPTLSNCPESWARFSNAGSPEGSNLELLPFITFLCWDRTNFSTSYYSIIHKTPISLSFESRLLNRLDSTTCWGFALVPPI